MRSGLGLLGLGALCAVAVSAGSVGGCQAGSNSTGSAGPGSGGGGSGSTSSNDGGGGASTMTTSSGTAGGGGSGGGSLPTATIQDITSGTIGEGVDVEVHGVVAMSHKWLVSKSTNTGSCLWGIFISAPGLTETEPYSGILAVSYGTPATTGDDGNLYCPRLGQEPAGDAFPDNVAPGDVLDLVGETSYFLLNACASQPPETNPSMVKQRQLAKVSKVDRTGTAPVPTPHLMPEADVAKLALGTDAAFHDMWGGVKVRVEDVAAPANTPAVDMYGVIKLAGSGLTVGSKIYYRPYSNNFCHSSPEFDDGTTFTRIDGFSYLRFCTWGIETNDKCADFSPASTDCAGAVTCEPDSMP